MMKKLKKAKFTISIMKYQIQPIYKRKKGTLDLM